MSETLVDQSIELVRQAVALTGKKPVARAADVAPGVLRRIGTPEFSCTTDSLRALEREAIKIIATSGSASSGLRHGDSATRNIRRRKAA